VNDQFSGHTIEIEDLGHEGFRVKCSPHGLIGVTQQTHLEAFILASQHDDRVSPWNLKGWS